MWHGGWQGQGVLVGVLEDHLAVDLTVAWLAIWTLVASPTLYFLTVVSIAQAVVIWVAFGGFLSSICWWYPWAQPSICFAVVSIETAPALMWHTSVASEGTFLLLVVIISPEATAHTFVLGYWAQHKALGEGKLSPEMWALESLQKHLPGNRGLWRRREQTFEGDYVGVSGLLISEGRLILLSVYLVSNK